jgi:predicted alpha-1,2-mannosidase
MKLFVFILLFSTGLLSCTKKTILKNTSPVQYVNTFIGTNNAGNTFPGAVRPWGMASVSPHNCLNFETDDQTQTGIYVHGQPHIYGFGHVHYSGVGCPIAGNIILMPNSGKLVINPAENRSAYSNEKSSPGYYEVSLDDSKILAQMTASQRCGISKYTFEDSKANITLDFSHPINGVSGGYVKLVSENEMEGFETDGGFCGSHLKYNVYFVVRFNKNAVNFGVYNEGKILDGKVAEGINVGAFYSFDLKDEKEIMVKVGISYVSIEQARKNLNAEISDFQFDKIRKDAEAEWLKQLGKIEVKGGTEEEKTMFYTALYHSLLLPFTSNDVDGKYRSFVSNQTRVLPFPERNDTTGAGTPFKILETETNRYSLFSLWDTYRTLHPLLILAYPEQQTEMVNTLVDKYKESGALPLWTINGIEWGGMVGDPAAIVIADTYLKGLRDFDLDMAFRAVQDNCNTPAEGGNNFRRGHNEYATLGYIPEDLKAQLGVWGTVSTAMEYSLADFAVAKMTSTMGHKKFADKLMDRSKAVLQLYDTESAFFRPKLNDKTWMEPFDVFTTAGEVIGHDHLGGPGYVEGNAWQYLFFLRQFPDKLSKLMDGNKAFTARLDECFEKDQFVLWNEPDMHYPFLYNNIEGEEWKTQREVTKAIKKHFNTSANGLPGNDDAGTISAWLVFAMMGIYPDAQGFTDYLLFKPTFEEVTIHLKNNKILQIINEKNSENQYIKKIYFNGSEVNGFKIDHHLISEGGKLLLTY